MSRSRLATTSSRSTRLNGSRRSKENDGRRVRGQRTRNQEEVMSTTEVQASPANTDPKGRVVDMKLEVVVIPVSDGERAANFYASLGWRQDVTPPGSGVYQFTP